MQELVIVILPIAILVLFWVRFGRVGTAGSWAEGFQEPKRSARWLTPILSAHTGQAPQVARVRDSRQQVPAPRGGSLCRFRPPGSPRFCSFRVLGVLICAAALLSDGVPARAQEIGRGIAENTAAGRSPTDFNSRVRVRSAYLDLPIDAELWTTSLSGTWAPIPSLALRLQLPLNYVDPEGSGAEFGMGDLSARALWRPWRNERLAAFVGLDLVFPTASDPILGTEKYSVAPAVAGFAQLMDRLAFIPVYQQIISFAGKDDRFDLNIVRFRPILVAYWPGELYTLLEPGFYWDLEDDRPNQDTMTLGLEVGRQLTKQTGLSAKPSVQVYGTEEFAWAFELTLSYRFD
jgi:hypothetical protein